MKKTNVVATLNPEIVERFSKEEMVVLAGGNGLLGLVLILIGGANIGDCRTTNTNCVTGCACSPS